MKAASIAEELMGTVDWLVSIVTQRLESAEELLLSGEPTDDLDHYRWLSLSWCLTEDRPLAAAAILSQLRSHASRLSDRDLADRLLTTLDLPTVSNRHTPDSDWVSDADLDSYALPFGGIN